MGQAEGEPAALPSLPSLGGLGAMEGGVWRLLTLLPPIPRSRGPQSGPGAEESDYPWSPGGRGGTGDARDTLIQAHVRTVLLPSSSSPGLLASESHSLVLTPWWLLCPLGGQRIPNKDVLFVLFCFVLFCFVLIAFLHPPLLALCLPKAGTRRLRQRAAYPSA